MKYKLCSALLSLLHLLADWHCSQVPVSPLQGVLTPFSGAAVLMTQQQKVVDELQHWMFEQVEGIWFDLSALTLQHGRDHSLPVSWLWEQSFQRQNSGNQAFL